MKLDRAQAHLAELNADVRDYLTSAPFSVDKEPGSGANTLVWRLRIRKPIPSGWALVVGDVVHNARAALDHLAWQLSSAPSRKTTFPIAASRPDFERLAPTALQSAPTSAVRLVRRLRPYDGGNRLLWQLHSLDIIDKHRILVIVGAAYSQVVLRLRMQVPWRSEAVVTPPIGLRPADRQFPLVDGAILFAAQDAVSFEAAHQDLGFAFEIAFGEPAQLGGLSVLATLERLLVHVSRIIELAERWVE